MQTNDAHRHERTPISEVNALLIKLGAVYSDLFPNEPINSFKDQYFKKMYAGESPFERVLSTLNKDLYPKDGDIFGNTQKKIGLLTIACCYCISAMKAYQQGAINEAWTFVVDAQLWGNVLIARKAGQINFYNENSVVTKLLRAGNVGLNTESSDYADIHLPAMPSLLHAIIKEGNSMATDYREIVRLIESNTAISVNLLKTLNSPLYAMNEPVKTITRASDLLGLKNLSVLVTSLSLRHAIHIAERTTQLDSLWEHSARTGLALAYLAPKIRNIDKNIAHLFGMFHDAGKALMLQHFVDYPETLRLSANTPELNLALIEESRHNCNHAQFGAMLATAWNLPEVIVHGVRIHHDMDAFVSRLASDVTLSLIALVNLAEYIESDNSPFSDNQWSTYKKEFMAQLAISDHQLDALCITTKEMLLM